MNQIIQIGAPIALIVLYIGIAWLWNTKYRPRQQAKGVAVDKFSGAFKRLFRFIFWEDVSPLLPKSKNPKLKKFLTFNTLYIALLIATVITLIVAPTYSWIPFLLFVSIIGTRAPKTLRERQKTLLRMLTVANSIFRYGRGAELNPWGYVNVKKWIGFTVPGQTVVNFPASWISSPPSRDAFEDHFNQTVTAENTWVYEWNTAEGFVVCAPVNHIPTKADYPGSADRPWNEIPLGIGAYGEIVWDVTKEPHALIAGKTGGGKSVAQRNIVFHTIQHNDKWCFLGVDPKRVELKPYKKYTNTVLGIATTLEDEVEVIRYAKEEMMRRYESMEEIGVNHFQDLPSPPRAIMVMVDEAYQLMAPEGVKTDEGKENDNLHGEASILIGEIARLGRAAGVHLALAMQRPDAIVLKGELKNNLDVRVAAGRLDSTPSSMVLDSGAATRVPGDIKGRGVVRIGGNNQQYQGYFATQGWIDEWLMKPENQHKEPEVVEAIKAQQSETPQNADFGNLEDFSELDNDFVDPEETPLDETRMDDSSDFLPEPPAEPTKAPEKQEVASTPAPAKKVEVPASTPEPPVVEAQKAPQQPPATPEPAFEAPSYAEKKDEIPSLDSLLGAMKPKVAEPVNSAPVEEKPTLPVKPVTLPVNPNPPTLAALPPRGAGLPSRPVIPTPNASPAANPLENRPTTLPKKPPVFGNNDSFSL